MTAAAMAASTPPLISSEEPPKTPASVNTTTNRSVEESPLHLPVVKDLGGGKNSANGSLLAEESFVALNPQKKNMVSREGAETSTSPSATPASPPSSDEENRSPGAGEGALVTLKRSGYYTIPPLADLATLVDPSTGACNVENFTVGRSGYGNIFFPGITDVTGLNLDEIVYIRHKEVIVYPDDEKKPELGKGLNRKAQITLDRVWPVDKTTKTSVRSPEKLLAMGYEDRLQKACIKLEARFVEYRVETGSWVFKVDHFSKYGLDDSDEEAAATDGKSLKTRGPPHLTRKQPPSSATVAAAAAAAASLQEQQAVDGKSVKEVRGVDQATEQQQVNEAQQPPLKKPSTRMQLMRSSLFDDDDQEEAMDEGVAAITAPPPKARPVILEAR